MGIAVGVAVVALAVGVQQADEQKSAARRGLKIQERQSDIQEAAEKIQLNQSRRQQLREERVRRAQILQRAEGAGVSGSSGVTTAISSISSRVGSNIAFQTGQGEAAEAISNLGVKAAGARARSTIAGARSNLAFNVFTQALSFASVKPKTSEKIVTNTSTI